MRFPCPWPTSRVCRGEPGLAHGFGIMALLLLAGPLAADVVINEVVASNLRSALDDEGASPDWVELLAIGDDPVQLAGYALSDDPAEPRKWAFPEALLEPGERLVVWCSGQDRTHVDPEVVEGDPRFAFQASLITLDSEWRYLVGMPGEEGPAGTWKEMGFDDSTWPTGRPGFGYGSPEHVVTEVPEGVTAVFLRHRFTITGPPASIVLQARYDDGLVVYLNGEEVLRENYEGEGLPTFDSTASRPHADRFEERWDLSPHRSLLVQGENVLAVAVLNRRATSNDLTFVPELGGLPPVYHTSFRLASSGETLLLIDPDGNTVDRVDFPELVEDQSYARSPDGTGPFVYHLTPTPGAVNAGPTSETPLVVADTTFSVDRGFFDEPFEVEISTETIGADIRYTTDGSAPTSEHGTLYTGPIAIQTTTVLRAMAFKEGLRPTDVDTQTYLFLADVIRQPRRPEGFPPRWGTRTADYEMDPDVVDDPAYSGEIVEGLRSIRSLSIVVDQDDWFNNPRGIYANPRSDGRDWERPISLEILHPDASERDVQVNCGIRIHGNGSRNANGQRKHSFRLEFRRDYGPGTFEYAMFPGSRVEEFDSLILRGQNAHGWTRSSQIANGVGTSEREQSQYIRDSFARDLHAAMGNVAGGATYVHLYVNGLYWGLYNPVEYPRAFFGASHFGGEAEEWDAINRRPTSAGGKGTHAIDGTKAAWDEMQRLANSGLETLEAYEAIQEHMDLDNMIDYLLVHQYMGSRDGPEVFNSNNMRAVRRSRGAEPLPWKCLLWDMEASMFEVNVTRNINVDDPDTIVRVYTRLRENPEFLVRYGDRVHRHFFNGGPLTPGRAEEIWEARAREIYSAIIGESARWGDERRARPFTRDAEWTTERNRLLETYFPTRTEFLLGILRRSRLYPELDAPLFQPHGGLARDGFELSMNGPDGSTIYYTLDGSDPRLTGGAIAAGALVYDAPVALADLVTVKARARRESEWSALTEAVFRFETRVVISEIMYHPLVPESPDGPFDEADFEFIELQNVGRASLDLSGARLSSGIDYAIPEGTILGPDEFLVIAKNVAAFATRYDTAGLNLLGDYDGRLRNSGERVILVEGSGSARTLAEVEFSDWYEETDGRGRSLVPVDPRDEAADWDRAESWRPSAAPNGSPGATDPGTTDTEEFVRGDADGDGSVSLTDAVFVLDFLFGAGRPPACMDSADANDDGEVVLTDAIFLLNHLFGGGPEMPAPFPESGEDPTPDEIGCR